MAEFTPNPKLDRAIDFSMGLLSKEEERSLLHEAKEDSELEEMMRQQCAFAERDKSEITHPERQMLLTKNGPARKTIYKWPRMTIWGTAIAASLALFLYLKPQSEPEHFWLPVDQAINVSRSEDANATGWRKGVELYAARDLESAIVIFQATETDGPEADLSNLYLTSALLNAGRMADAQATFELIEIEFLPYAWRELAMKLQGQLNKEK